MISRKGGILDILWIVACLDGLVPVARPQNFSRRPSTEADKGERVLSRQKRYLIFPQGSNVQLAYCLTIGAYNPYGSGNLVIGMTAALAWELPSKVDHTVPDLLHRRSRSVVYPKIEALLQSVGLDGRSCVMRALCEAGQRDESEIGEGTFVQELLHAIFTLPKDGSAFESVEDRAYDYAHETREDCAALYSTCDRSIYDFEF